MIDYSLTKIFKLEVEHKHPAILLGSYLSVDDSIYIPDRIIFQSLTREPVSQVLFANGWINSFNIPQNYIYRFELYFNSGNSPHDLYQSRWEFKFINSEGNGYIFNESNSILMIVTTDISSKGYTLNLTIQTRGNNAHTILT